MTFLQLAEELKEKLIKYRRHLHQHPELSFSECETSKFVVKILKEEGIDVTSGVAGTGVVGIIRGNSPGSTIALRADMDALPIEEQTGLEFTSKNPGVMHACGHDFHTTILLGSAILLHRNKDKLKGTVKLIFQPGEERLTGARQMIKAGVLENPRIDALVALHTWPELPSGTIGIRKGAITAAADFLEIDIIGKSGHAAHPEQCADPIVIAGHVVTVLQTIVSREVAPTDPAVVTIGKISGGTASNIIPESVRLSGMIRTVNPELQKRMPEMIKRIITKTAESMNGNAKIKYTSAIPPFICDDSLVDIIDEVASDTLGEGNVVHLPNPSLGSEDCAAYLEHVPGVLFRLGTHNEEESSKLGLHNSGVTFEEEALVTGVAVMSEATIRYLEHGARHRHNSVNFV